MIKLIPKCELKLEQRVNINLVLLEKNKIYFPYRLNINSKKKVSLNNKFEEVEPSNQKNIIENIVNYHKNINLRYPEDWGQLSIYNEKLKCIESYLLKEIGSGSEGTITSVESFRDKGKKDFLQKYSSSLIKQINKEKEKI